MKRIAICFCLWLAQAAPALDFNKYHSQAEIVSYLQKAAQDNAGLVTYEHLGESDEGRSLDYVVITRAQRTAPAIYLNGTHHGNEKSSTETTLGVIDHLIAHAGDAEIKALLDRYQIIVQPIVNADGHAANTREDSHGRDPNRDYDYPGQSGEKFKIGFIRLVRGVFERFKVRAAVAYHSGMVGVLWPWCAKSASTEMKDTFHTLAKRSAEAMGFDYYRQSYFDYPSSGEFIDYAFMKHGTIGLTFEVSQAGNPSTSSLPKVVQKAVQGTLTFMRDIAALDQGRLALQHLPIEEATPSFNPLFARLGGKVE